MTRAIIALGANIRGPWGTPVKTLETAIVRLERAGAAPQLCSRMIITEAVGIGPAPTFVNCVIVVESKLAPAALLRVAKSIERAAGRRDHRPGSRPLDVDIVDFGGLRLGRPGARRQRGRLMLPHPGLHWRRFVLAPLAEVAPGWHHPVLQRTARQLLARHDGLSRPAGYALDLPKVPCD